MIQYIGLEWYLHLIAFMLRISKHRHIESSLISIPSADVHWILAWCDTSHPDWASIDVDWSTFPLPVINEVEVCLHSHLGMVFRQVLDYREDRLVGQLAVTSQEAVLALVAWGCLGKGPGVLRVLGLVLVEIILINKSPGWGIIIIVGRNRWWGFGLGLGWWSCVVFWVQWSLGQPAGGGTLHLKQTGDRIAVILRGCSVCLGFSVSLIFLWVLNN